AATLGDGDINTVTDVYVRRIDAARTIVVSTNEFGLTATYASGHGTLTTDGHYVGFTARAPLEDDDTNAVPEPYVRSVVVPTITSVAPNRVAPGQSATFVLTGDGFLPNAAVYVTDGVVVQSATVVSEQRLDVTVVAAPGATAGPRDLYVFDPGEGPLGD